VRFSYRFVSFRIVHYTEGTLISIGESGLLSMAQSPFISNKLSSANLVSVQDRIVCADVRIALDRGTKGRETDEFTRSVIEAIEQLTVRVKPARGASCVQFTYHAFDSRTAAEIQGKIVKWGKRNPVSRFIHARNDEEAIATWRLDFIRILQVFNVRPARSYMTVTNFPVLGRTCNKHTRDTVPQTQAPLSRMSVMISQITTLSLPKFVTSRILSLSFPRSGMTL